MGIYISYIYTVSAVRLTKKNLDLKKYIVYSIAYMSEV